MKTSINKVKKWRWILIAVLFISIPCPLLANQYQKVFQIDFQDFFTQDTVSLKINNCNIIYCGVLNSDPATGLTNLILKGSISKKTISIKSNGKKYRCKIVDGKIKLTVYLNGIQNLFFIDLAKGSYIGLCNTGQNIISLKQSITSFEYD